MGYGRKNGGPAVVLPFEDVDPSDNSLYTDLANNPEGRARTGWALVDAPPVAAPGHHVEWSEVAESWVQVEGPSAPAARVCSVYEFMYGRVTQTERLAIRASADPLVIDFAEALRVVSQVELDGPLTVAGVNYCESAGLLAEGRAAEILAA